MGKISLILLGWFSLAIGTVGIFVPLLPTVPLWLLSAWCFSRSSDRLHTWLMQHPRFGPVIENWQAGNGISKKIKFRAIALLWLSLGISMFIVGKVWLVVMLASIGLATSIYIGRLPVSDK